MADTMSKTERQTLIRLVKQRFKLLEKGLDARRSQLRQLIREEVLKENEDKVAAYKKQLNDKVKEPLQELQKEAWVIIKQAEQDGLSRSGYSSYRFDNWAADMKDVTFIPAKLDQEVNKRLAEMIGDKPMSAYALQAQESKLIEELLVGDLSSDGAKDFLAQIPTLEGLIPLPAGANGKLAALESGDE